jgi:hypothetical protein
MQRLTSTNRLYNAVDHRMLGRNLGSLCAREHKNRAVGRNRYSLQLVNELVERLFVLCDTLGGYDAVDYQNGGTSRRDFTPQQGQQILEATVVQHAQPINIGQLVRNLRTIKKGHDAQMLHQTSMVFGEQGDVERSAT